MHERESSAQRMRSAKKFCFFVITLGHAADTGEKQLTNAQKWWKNPLFQPLFNGRCIKVFLLLLDRFSEAEL